MRRTKLNDILCGLFFTLLFVILAIYHQIKTENNRTLMEGIFLNGTQGIILTDASGNIVLMNPFSEKMFGYTPNELIKSKAKILFPEINLSSAKHSFSKEPAGFRQDCFAHKKDGSIFPTEISLNKYKSGGLFYVVVFINDITTRKKNEEILHSKKKELEDVNKELEAFSYSVSHDLRAPLRAICGYAKMLEEDYGPILNEDGKRLLLIISQSAKKMGNLIDDLLDFSRLGRKEIRKVIVNMAEVVDKTLYEINKVTQNKAKVVIHSLHPTMADPALISYALTNLLSNAIKYTSKVESPFIEIESVEKEGKIIYSIKDNGAGFDMKYSKKLFGVFQRLHSNEEFEGTGVGLAITQKIIQKHNGEIWADGKVGTGATFYFSLPKIDGNFSKMN